MVSSPNSKLRLGKIGFLNVLPIYFPIEIGAVAHSFTIISGTPSQLNGLMARGELDISAVSSIEYARHPERYLIVPDLSITCKGAVKSVVLLSKVPVHELSRQTILASTHSHTSVSLLKLVLYYLYGFHPNLETGNCSEALNNGRQPVAMLTIGDEALRLSSHSSYPYRIDLGEAWSSWTGLPFVFALWAVQRSAVETHAPAVHEAIETLLNAKRWGCTNLDIICTEAQKQGTLGFKEARDYYQCLHYDLGEKEKEGLAMFYRYLASISEIEDFPPLQICSPYARAA